MKEVLAILFVAVLFIVYYIKRKKEHKENVAEYNTCKKILTHDELDSKIIAVSNPDQSIAQQYKYMYSLSDMPLGRATAFLNYHQTSIFDEEPYFFLCKRSSKDNEFREYGCIVARNGIYISIEHPNNKSRKEKESPLPGEDITIPFKGLAGIKERGKKLCLVYVRPEKHLDQNIKIRIKNDIARKYLLEVLLFIVKSEIGIIMLKGNVVEDITELPDAFIRTFGSIDEAHSYYIRTKRKTEILLDQAGINTGLAVVGVQASQPQNHAFYQENKNYMNGSRGYGYAAEYGNNAVDRFFAKKVENAAQQLQNGHQAKHGADRIVNGIEIQTKYYQSASETVGAAFERKQAIYIRSDGTKKMMAIEVPRDQYHDALKLMQKRIDNGQVPNVDPGESAENYIRKGHFTYSQAYLIAQSGTIESLTVDTISGAVCCTQAAGITATIAFAMAIWNGQSVEEALKQSLQIGLKVLGQGTLIYTLTMQLSRENIANIWGGKNIVDGIFKGYKSIKNPVFSISENLATKLNTSSLTKTKVGQGLGIESVTGRQIIGGVVTVAVVFGPDVGRALVGKISPRQLVKNATIGVAGIVGAVIGQALIPIPIAGGAIGGAVTSYIAKRTLDHFIEDDAKEMFRILKEEFLDIIMLACLTTEEFNEVVKLTIGNKKIAKQFRNMYQSKAEREYARNAIMIPAIHSVLKKRSRIKNATFLNKLNSYILDVNLG